MVYCTEIAAAVTPASHRLCIACGLRAPLIQLEVTEPGTSACGFDGHGAQTVNYRDRERRPRAASGRTLVQHLQQLSYIIFMRPLIRIHVRTDERHKLAAYNANG